MEDEQYSEKHTISATQSKLFNIKSEIPPISSDRIQFIGKLTINISVLAKKNVEKVP